jgi:hypothetical protein
LFLAGSVGSWARYGGHPASDVDELLPGAWLAARDDE